MQFVLSCSISLLRTDPYRNFPVVALAALQNDIDQETDPDKKADLEDDKTDLLELIAGLCAEIENLEEKWEGEDADPSDTPEEAEEKQKKKDSLKKIVKACAKAGIDAALPKLPPNPPPGTPTKNQECGPFPFPTLGADGKLSGGLDNTIGSCGGCDDPASNCP